MSKYNTCVLVRDLRERIGLEREAVLELSNLDDSSLRRIEREEQHPKPETLKKLIKAIKLPLDGLVYPLLDELPMGALLLCDRLTQALDIGDLASAEMALEQLEKFPKFETGVLTQFKLSSKARLWELQGKSIDDILPLLDEGMRETFENFDDNDIPDKVLILEEPELLHTKARLLAKSGQLDDAILILDSMVSNLKKIPSTDREKERQFAPLIFSLTKCLLEKRDYIRVLELCDLGAEYSAVRKQGYLNPDFELLKAAALRGLGQNEDCQKPLQHAYFAFILLGESVKATEVLNCANDVYNIQIQTYGVDELIFSNHCKVPYNRGEAVECYSFGTMIRALRERAGLSLEKLSRGICSKPTLLRIERDETLENYFTVEAIMQRLGRDINLYKNFFMSKNDFVSFQLQDKIKNLLSECQFTSASKLIDELRSIKSVVNNNVLRQFILMTQAILFARKHNEPQPEYLNMLLDALHITCPQFDEHEIEKYHLTFNEIAIINQYAGYFGDSGDPKRSAVIYDRLRRNINGNYKDEVEKARMYSTVLFNCSSIYGRAGCQNEAFDVMTEGENFERNRGRLIELPAFSFNKGYYFMLQEKNEESLPYFALAYYGASLFAKHGQEHILPIIQTTVDEHLGITFD